MRVLVVTRALLEASLKVGAEFRARSGRVESGTSEVEEAEEDEKSWGIVTHDKKIQTPEIRKKTMDD